MDNSITRIQLIGENEGYLEVASDIIVPLNYGVSDVRDISKRTGTFSKTIVIPGTKNNNLLLNQYFDVNVQDGTFSINRVQKCIILQNNIPVVTNAVMQLVAVNKVEQTINEDQTVEYEVVIKDNVGDFFTKLGNRTLEGKDENGNPFLDFTIFDHVFTAAKVTESFDNTSVDGYKYLLPYGEDNNYFLAECKPAIYAKQYWDKIHASTGFTYDWPTLTNPNVQFDKLVIPYNGDDKKLTEESISGVAVSLIQDATGPTNRVLGSGAPDSFNGNFAGSPVGYTPPDFFINVPFKGYGNIAFQTLNGNGRFDLPPEVDNLGQWSQPGGQNSGTGQLVNQLSLTTANAGINVRLTGTLTFTIANGGSQASSVAVGTINDTGAPFFTGPFYDGSRARMALVINKVNFPQQEYNAFIPVGNLFPPGQSYAPFTSTQTATNVPFDITVFIPNVAIGDTFTVGTRFFTDFQGSLVAGATQPRGEIIYFRNNLTSNNSNTFPGTSLSAQINDLAVVFSPVTSVLLFGAPVQINQFVPKKIKQSDFIKSICLMYNLYVETDPSNDNRLIYRHRDDFYDSGQVRDWTEKLDRSRDQKVNFLPELSNKRLKLTYKESDDLYNNLYTATTVEIYGQQEVVFQNEYVKGTDVKELIFSPTPSQPTSFNAVLPLIPGISPKGNPRILLDSGLRDCGDYNIINYEATPDLPANAEYGLTKYPLLSHFNNTYGPTFDINFGVCDFYFYDIEDFTLNNLFNNFWRRTVAQIDQGKLMTAYFMLDENDMSVLKLNDLIRINNSWWNINKIIDYNANARVATKVELLAIDPALRLPSLVLSGGGNDGSNFAPEWNQYAPLNRGQLGNPPLRPVTPFMEIKAINRQLSTERLDKLNAWQATGTGLILGTSNQIPANWKGVVVGDGRVIPSVDGVYVGDYGLTSQGLSRVLNRVGVNRIIDGGIDMVLPYSKTNLSDIIDGGEDSVRKFGGGTPGGFIIDPRNSAEID